MSPNIIDFSLSLSPVRRFSLSLSLALFASAAKEYFDLRAIFIQFKAAGVGVIKENKIAPLWPRRDSRAPLALHHGNWLFSKLRFGV
jgi:hypothetical protein